MTGGQAPIIPHPRKYEPESNHKWDAAHQEDDVFFNCVPRLDAGESYAGHTRDLRERMGEHCDEKTRSPAGRNPLLVWLDVVGAKGEAAEIWADLKERIERKGREVRRIVSEFPDISSLVHWELFDTFDSLLNEKAASRAVTLAPFTPLD